MISSNIWKRGVILITTIMVGAIITVLGSAYVTSVVIQHMMDRNHIDNIKAIYAAEKGVEYGFTEFKRNTYAWGTHEVDPDPDNNNILNRTTPFDSSLGGVYDDATGSYIYDIYEDALDAKVEVRAYKDPDNEDQYIILSRGTVGRAQRVLKYKIGSTSLYQYFLFYPDGYWTQWSFDGKTIDGEPIGAIHVNGDLSVVRGQYNNIREFSISGHAFYSSTNINFHPAYYYDDNDEYGNSDAPIDGVAPIPRNDFPPYAFKYPLHDTDPVLGFDGGLGILRRSPFLDPGLHFWGSYYTDNTPGEFDPHTYGHFCINKDDDGEWNRVPKILPENPPKWGWDKYNGNPGYSGYPGGIEMEVRFDPSYNEDEAILWLIDEETKRGEVFLPTFYNDWDSIWEWEKDDTGFTGGGAVKEYFPVSVLNTIVETDPGPGAPGNPNPEGLLAGLQGNSERDIYNAVKQYKLHVEDSETYPDEFPSYVHETTMQNWIKNGLLGGEEPGDFVSAFLSWWKLREYHHGEELDPAVDHRTGEPIQKFPSDADVPAWERIFWEAWLNYWPPAAAFNSFAHNKVYTESGNAAHTSHAINAEWWEDLSYGDDRAGLTKDDDDMLLQVEYLNTEYQWEEFNAFLDSTINADNDVFLYEANGGKYEVPLSIGDYYPGMAQGNGLYIVEDRDPDTGAGLETFTVTFRGEEETGTLDECITDLGLSSWLDTDEFANACYSTDLNWDPDPDDDGENIILPPNINVIQIDVGALKDAIAALGEGEVWEKVVYIEAPSYDTRLVNGKALPDGGFTVVSPYDVYVKAVEDNETGETIGLFHYAETDKEFSTDGPDNNFQPAAIITNSRVWFLSSEFEDVVPDPNDPKSFPYPLRFPRSPYSLEEPTFLDDYCWGEAGELWPNELADQKPAVKPEDFVTWVDENLTPDQQKDLLDGGEDNYKVVEDAKITNNVNYNNYYNVAVVSPVNPLGDYAEYWTDDNGTQKKWYVEGAFIELQREITVGGEEVYVGWAEWNGQPVYREHLKHHNEWQFAKFERLRFDLLVEATYMLAHYPYSVYQYEERFYDEDWGERPPGDLLSGHQQVWEELRRSNAFTHHQDLPII